MNISFFSRKSKEKSRKRKAKAEGKRLYTMPFDMRGFVRFGRGEFGEHVVYNCER